MRLNDKNTRKGRHLTPEERIALQAQVCKEIKQLQQENNSWQKRYDELDAGHSRLFKDFCKLQQENEQLRAQVGKPTIEQVAWIVKCICQNADEQGTFRHLIYDIMGYGGEAYQPLCGAGLLRINNSMTELTPEQVEALQQENENLKAALTADKDEQMKRLEGGLKKLRSSFQWLSESIRDLGYRAWAEDNIDKIDALLGGKEDV